MSVGIRGVTKRFGASVVLDAVSLAVRKSELCVLLGPTGCGKTTLLRCAAGLEELSAGTIFHDVGEGPAPPSPGRSCTLVFQDHNLFPNLNALDNVAYGPRAQRFSRGGVRAKLAELWAPFSRRGEGEALRARVRPLLELLAVSDCAERMPSELSGGQRQRVSIARALAVEPRVLLLDEPLSAVDRNLRTELRERLRAHIQAHGITALWVTHDQEEALAIGDRIAIMNRGRVMEVGAPDEVYARPTSAFSAEFLGSGNLFEGRVQHASRGATVLACEHGRLRTSQNSLAVGDGATVLVRPEAVRLAKLPEGDGHGAPQENEFVGVVRRTACLGPVVSVTIALPATTLRAILLRHPSAYLAPGDHVKASFSADDVHVVARSRPAAGCH